MEEEGLQLHVPIGYSLEQLLAEEARLMKAIQHLQQNSLILKEQLSGAVDATQQKLSRALRANQKQLERNQRALHDLRSHIKNADRKQGKLAKAKLKEANRRAGAGLTNKKVRLPLYVYAIVAVFPSFAARAIFSVARHFCLL
jgi:hypothetical protein